MLGALQSFSKLSPKKRFTQKKKEAELEKEIQNNQVTITTLNKQVKRLNEVNSSLQMRYEKLEQNVKELQDNNISLRGAKAEQAINVHQMKSQVAIQSEEAESHKERCKQLAGKIYMAKANYEILKEICSKLLLKCEEPLQSINGSTISKLK